MKLGLKRNEVLLMPYDPQWKELFNQEKDKLIKTLGKNTKVEHIGSTAISTIVAKPIIDILVGVENLGNRQQLIQSMIELRYDYLPEQSFPDRLFFVKLDDSRDTHHLHIIEYDSLPWKRAVGFRDFLLHHQEVASGYEKVKQQLARQFAHDRNRYSSEKQRYLQQIFSQM